MSAAAKKEAITNWAPIFGQWDFDNGHAVYQGPSPGQREFGICVSGERFVEGDVEGTVCNPKAKPDCRILFGYRAPTQDHYLVGIGGHGAAYSIVRFSLATGWQAIVTAGDGTNLIEGHQYQIKVQVRGQQISLEVDGIRVLEHVLPEPLPYGQLGLFAWDKSGGTEFSNFSVSKEPGQVFVVMQFAGFEDLYKDVIKPVTESFNLHPYRADEVFGPGNILSDIIHGIETAQIIIAEITLPNENVFYELGYAHGLKKPTILIAEKAKNLPFDLSGYRCLLYENTIGGKLKIEDGLRKHLQAILQD